MKQLPRAAAKEARNMTRVRCKVEKYHGFGVQGPSRLRESLNPKPWTHMGKGIHRTEILEVLKRR